MKVTPLFLIAILFARRASAEFYEVIASGRGIEVQIYSQEAGFNDSLSSRLVKAVTEKPNQGIRDSLLAEVLAALNFAKNETIFIKLATQEKTIAIPVGSIKELNVWLNEAGSTHVGTINLHVNDNKPAELSAHGTSGIATKGKESPFKETLPIKNLAWKDESTDTRSLTIGEAKLFFKKDTGFTYFDKKNKQSVVIGVQEQFWDWPPNPKAGPTLKDGSTLVWVNLPEREGGFIGQKLLRFFPDGTVKEETFAKGSTGC